MNWITLTVLVILSICSCDGRRRVHRPCRASASSCAQRCLIYPSKRVRCVCYNGFMVSRRNKKDCVDVNECDTNNGGCDHTCTNIPGGRLCSCRVGFKLAANSKTCIPQDLSTECIGVTNQCEHFCNRTSSGQLCSCRQGFRLHSNGKNCIRKCLYGNGGCSHICNPERDRMFCTCRPNYRLAEDGRTCIALHTCAIDNGGCNVECEDTPIGVQCSCKRGYLLKSDQRSCQDIDECATNNGGCQHGCRNSQGSFICTCPTGYKLAPNELDCVDINECLLNDTCWSGCINSPGSYRCTCEQGFQKFAVKRCGANESYNFGSDFEVRDRKKNFTDVDECTVDNGGCSHICTNTPGGYRCSCNPGHKLLWNQKDCVRESRCYSLKQGIKPAAVIKTLRREALLDCHSSNIFTPYNAPRPSYRFICGDGAGYHSTIKREKRISVAKARPQWWNNHLEINDTLPDCADSTSTKYRYRFMFLSDHCHLLRLKSKPSLDARSPRAFIKYFSVTCEKKLRGKARLTVLVVLQVRITSKRKKKRVLRAAKKTMGAMKRAIQRQQFRIKFGSSYLLIRRKSTVKRRGAKPTPGIHLSNGCVLGSIQNEETCERCNTGTFFDLANSSCSPCLPGTYQNRKGELSCNKCPLNLPGKVGGLADISKCPGACPPGLYSRDGFQPCRPCPVGYYQPESGRIACFKCGHGLTTRSAGSQSFSSCLVRALCSAGHFYNIHTSSCRRCPVGFYQPDPGKNFCFSCPGNTTTDYDASDSVESCKDTHCGSVIEDLQGVIESPNYPGNYPINTQCTWVIKPPRKRKLLLVIPEIFLPGGDCEDSLIMKSRRGSSSGRVTYQSCQTFQNPSVVTARSKRLFIEFKSNSQVAAKGFQIPYVTYDENYDKIILDIIRDYRLFSPNFHQNILKDKRSRQTLFNVLAKPEMYFSISPQITDELFPSSFVTFLEQKVTKFFSHR